jgi:hypothetical protein
MSVYTAQQSQLGQQQPFGGQQFGQPQAPFGQQFFGQQAPQWGQQPQWGQGLGSMIGQPYGMQQPYAAGQSGQYGPQSGQAQSQFPSMSGSGQLPQLVSDLALKCAASAVQAVVEQLRFDPQALMGIQAQGQIPPHVYSSVLIESARRMAPLVHIALATVTGQPVPGQQIPGGPMPGQQLPGQPFGMQQPYQMAGMSPLMGAGF